ncbi:antibiotic biosynthesis monooxygenase family protein [Streptomyces pristinaespiralis]|jgi:quinol monooxygenase YgiN|uniref:Oxygenase n=2 Tax=Streptomyces pristinaespiralis TaxID=38300 RepID=B5HJX8_STRE2|nr:antibiotic biosynthesis monooxygenase family protein [Streptomyces pristinaespiralis]ALC18508.1 oxygenase [Streptomyces pristinaespiralis]ALC25457.1 oxygenase [Streptomyces pristinaespiralis]EDY67139.1 oxygenase [Streptomyces pristinaespiralis ATCC 25486]QMU12340.1 antibiotic biosynthesis monooxygenase [Streptomyces pristinaespiralis]CBW45656.1 putative oxygenase [Streptomyces pristinaespiralis]
MVTFVNKLTVHGDHDAFLAVRARLTAYMSAQPGYVSHQNLRALGAGNVHLEIAVWDSAEAHRAAVGSDGFRAIVADLKPLVTAEPAMYETEDAAAPLEAAGVR